MNRDEVEQHIVRELDETLRDIYWKNLKFLVSSQDTLSESFQVAIEIDRVFRKHARRSDRMTQSQTA